MTPQIKTNFVLSDGLTQVMVIPYKDGSFSLSFINTDDKASTIKIRDKNQLKWLSKFLSDAESVLIEDSSSVYSGTVI